MKLYWMQGACSLAANIALREAGLSFSTERLDMKTQALEGGRPMSAVNDKGYVPVLEFDDGTRLTEVIAILLWVADQKPGSKLSPPPGSLERYRLFEWLSFIATEIHKIYWPLFHDGAAIENEHARAALSRRFSWVEEKLADSPFLMGQDFTVADAYLLTVLNWTKPAGIDLNAWPKLKEYRARLRERPAVIEALKAEGLLR